LLIVWIICHSREGGNPLKMQTFHKKLFLIHKLIKKDSGQARMTPSTMIKMKVALVHDDLVQWGGAERVLLAISECFPDAPIYTSVFDKSNPMLSQAFGSKKVITSFMQRIPGWKNLYKSLLPLYPIAFEQFNFSDYDVVISQTTRFAKSIITKPNTKHICYLHTPPRFLSKIFMEFFI
jgi:hypothetical protein